MAVAEEPTGRRIEEESEAVEESESETTTRIDTLSVAETVDSLEVESLETALSEAEAEEDTLNVSATESVTDPELLLLRSRTILRVEVAVAVEEPDSASIGCAESVAVAVEETFSVKFWVSPVSTVSLTVSVAVAVDDFAKTPLIDTDEEADPDEETSSISDSEEVSVAVAVELPANTQEI